MSNTTAVFIARFLLARHAAAALLNSLAIGFSSSQPPYLTWLPASFGIRNWFYIGLGLPQTKYSG